MAQAEADLVDGEHAVGHGGHGAHGDEGVHVGRAPEQGLEAHLVVLVVEIHDGQGQQQLREGEGQGVVHAGEKAWQGRAHHVAHGDVEQGDEEGEGPDHPMLHLGQLAGHHVLLPDGGRGGPRRLGQGGPVAGVLHRRDNGLRGGGVLVVCHLHGVGQEAHVHLRHPIQPAHRLLHVGGAGGAGHAGHVESLLHGCYLAISSISEARSPARRSPRRFPGAGSRPRRCAGARPAAPC